MTEEGQQRDSGRPLRAGMCSAIGSYISPHLDAIFRDAEASATKAPDTDELFVSRTVPLALMWAAGLGMLERLRPLAASQRFEDVRQLSQVRIGEYLEAECIIIRVDEDSGVAHGSLTIYGDESGPALAANYKVLTGQH